MCFNFVYFDKVPLPHSASKSIAAGSTLRQQRMYYIVTIKCFKSNQIKITTKNTSDLQVETDIVALI